MRGRASAISSAAGARALRGARMAADGRRRCPPGCENGSRKYILTFSHEFTGPADDVVYFAMCFPCVRGRKGGGVASLMRSLSRVVVTRTRRNNGTRARSQCGTPPFSRAGSCATRLRVRDQQQSARALLRGAPCVVVLIDCLRVAPAVARAQAIVATCSSSASAARAMRRCRRAP